MPRVRQPPRRAILLAGGRGARAVRGPEDLFALACRRRAVAPLGAVPAVVRDPERVLRRHHGHLRGPAVPGLPTEPLVARGRVPLGRRGGPVVLVGLLGGAMADAFDRRTMVLWSEVGLAACSLVLVANASLWVPRLWPLFVIAVLAATFDSLQRPSLDAMVPRLVPTEDIPAAIVLSNLRSSVGMVAGPALAGGLIALAGLGIAYGLDVATFSVSLLALFGLAAVPPAADAEPLGLARIMEGLRYARSRQDLLGTYAVDMAAMFFGMPQALFPQLATTSAARASSDCSTPPRRSAPSWWVRPAAGSAGSVGRARARLCGVRLGPRHRRLRLRCVTVDSPGAAGRGRRLRHGERVHALDHLEPVGPRLATGSPRGHRAHQLLHRSLAREPRGRTGRGPLQPALLYRLRWRRLRARHRRPRRGAAGALALRRRSLRCRAPAAP